MQTTQKIYHSGDVMYDNSLHFSEVAEQKTSVISKNNLEKNNFILATIHRNNNTDEPIRLNALFNALYKISEQNQLDVLLPLHPRAAKLLEVNLDKELHQKIKASTHFKINCTCFIFRNDCFRKELQNCIDDR